MKPASRPPTMLKGMKRSFIRCVYISHARGGIRTHTPSRAIGFKPIASDQKFRHPGQVDGSGAAPRRLAPAVAQLSRCYGVTKPGTQSGIFRGSIRTPTHSAVAGAGRAF